MANLKYSEEHEWVRVEDGVAVVGISEHAQAQLGDIVFVEFPEVDDKVSQGTAAGVVESVKAASDVYAPVSGTIVEVNEALNDEPAKVNADPLGEGWFFKIRMSDPSELDDLMDEAEYASFLAGQA
jgi:glycine cleavage system H protein